MEGGTSDTNRWPETDVAFGGSLLAVTASIVVIVAGASVDEIPLLTHFVARPKARELQPEVNIWDEMMCSRWVNSFKAGG
jgi:hypothetical protein